MRKNFNKLCFLIILILSITTKESRGNSMSNTAYHISFENIYNQDEKLNLADFEGKLIMVINTASECGFTKQYKELEELWQTYKDRGLVVIAVPSNDFGGQEPGDNEDIKKFLKEKYNTSFYVATKQNVTGNQAHEFFKWFEAEKGKLARPRWNFFKYFIAPNGEALTWFSSMTKPDSEKILKTLRENLPE